MILFVYTTTQKRFVICRYFKLSWNATALSQSNCRNFSCGSIILWIVTPGTYKRVSLIWFWSGDKEALLYTSSVPAFPGWKRVGRNKLKLELSIYIRYITNFLYRLRYTMAPVYFTFIVTQTFEETWKWLYTDISIYKQIWRSVTDIRLTTSSFPLLTWDHQQWMILYTIPFIPRILTCLNPPFQGTA